MNSICHMPMARAQAEAEGGKGRVFDHFPIGRGASQQDLLAADGVSCTLCHQITDLKFGMPEGFTGGFVVDRSPPTEERQIFRFEIDAGRTTIMRSATGSVRPRPRISSNRNYAPHVIRCTRKRSGRAGKS
jgi:hypothetical protein